MHARFPECSLGIRGYSSGGYTTIVTVLDARPAQDIGLIVGLAFAAIIAWLLVRWSIWCEGSIGGKINQSNR